MSSEIACLEEIRGRCMAVRINWPDTEPLMQSAYAEISEHLHTLSKRPLTDIELNALIEELTNLKNYIEFVLKQAPETSGEIKPLLAAIDWIFEPAKTH